MTLAQFLQIVLARRKVALGVFFGVVATTIILSLVLPKQYTAETTLSIEVAAADPVTGVVLAGQLMPSYLATQVEIISSHNAALHVVDSLGLDKLPDVQARFADEAGGKGDIRDWLADLLLKKLDVKPSRESNIVTISYTSGDPKFASALANGFAQAYIRTVIDIRTAAAQQNNAFFQEQIKGLQNSLEDAQKRLADFQQVQGITTTDEHVDVETQRLSDISAQLVAAQAQTFDAQSRARVGADVAPDVLNNPLIQQLKNTLTQKEAAFKELSEREGVNHPRYKEAQAELEATRQQLETLKKQYTTGLSDAASNSATRMRALQQALAQQKGKVLELKTERSKLDVLQRNVDNAQKAYDLAMARLAETALESRSNVANVGILKSAPEPIEPSRPRLAINIILSIFVGTVLAIGIAVLAELRDRRIRSVADIDLLLGIPVLANLSIATSKKEAKGRGLFRFVTNFRLAKGARA
ncbi:MAG: chain length determinant protein EpsF [Burkholderiales bacterium]|nr:chain length determinant protein EpsF [Burkholderiales bacterium]